VRSAPLGSIARRIWVAWVTHRRKLGVDPRGEIDAKWLAERCAADKEWETAAQLLPQWGNGSACGDLAAIVRVVGEHLCTLDGTHDRISVRQLAWPNVWTTRSRETDACDEARWGLAAEAMELLRSTDQPAEVVVRDGVIEGMVPRQAQADLDDLEHSA
jgi:hypothetical protein